MRFSISENFEKRLVAALLAALVVFMLAAALCRHLAPEWNAYPLRASAGCLAWLGSLGMARAASLGIHVRVSVLENTASIRNRKRLHILADALFFLFAFAMLVVGLIVFIAAVRHPSPMAHPLICASIPAGSLLTMLRLAERLRGRRGA